MNNYENYSYLNTFSKTFTGSDTLAFIIFPETKPIILGSLTTISYSLYREKKPVPLVGKINTGGYTRGMRTIAGTMIFTLINQHFIQDILQNVEYLKQHGRIKPDELPMFDILLVSANESGTNAQMMIYGAEFVDDSQVVSVQDMYIENSLSFVARDLDEFKSINPLESQGNGRSVKNGTASVLIPGEFSLNGYKDSMNNTMSLINNEELMKVQVKLKESGYLSKVSGVLNTETSEALIKIQEDNNITATGVLDNATYNLIMKDFKCDIATIENKNGAFVYSNSNKDGIIGISKYRESFVYEIKNDMLEVDFCGKRGYVDKSDTSLTKVKNVHIRAFSEHSRVNSTTLENFKPNYVGGEVQALDDISVKVTAISHYGDNVITNSKIYELSNGTKKNISLSLIPEAFIYNKDFKALPNKIEFCLLATNNDPIKWTINITK